jgi:hypothetical protein
LFPAQLIYVAASLIIGAVLLLFLLAVSGAIFGNLNIGYFLGWVGRGFALMAVLVAVDVAAGLLLPPGVSPLVLNFIFQVCLLTAGLMIVFRLPAWHAAVVALFTIFLWSLARLAVEFFLAAALTASI